MTRVDSMAPLMHHDPSDLEITVPDPDPDDAKGTFPVP